MKIRKTSLSSMDGPAVVEQEATIDTSSPVNDSNMNLVCAASSVICITLTGIKDDANVIPVLHSVTKVNFDESLSSKMDEFSIVKNKRIDVHNHITTEDNLSHGAYMLQDNITGNNEPKSFPKRQKSNISLAGTNGTGTLHCKILLIFAVCCIIGCCLIPATFYYISQTKNRVATTDPEYSHINNTSAKVSHA